MKREENSIVNSQGSLSVSDESIARLLCDDNHVEEAVRLIMKKYGEPLRYIGTFAEWWWPMMMLRTACRRQ